MPETDIGKAQIGNMSSTVPDYSVDAISTDGAGDQKETEWNNTKWTQQLGYYKTIPELRAVVDTVARWTIGKGYKADAETKFILDGIRGHGKDTFNSILENQIRVMEIGGGSFAEIIRHGGFWNRIKNFFKEDEGLKNLKALDPGSMKTIVNRKGRIIRYEQINKVKGSKKKFKPANIFHLTRNRVADEIHGVSMIDALEWIILARNEAMADMKTLMHRYVKPLIAFKLDTDDEAEIAAYILKMDTAVKKGENLFYPKDTVEHEVISVPANATLNPLPWIDRLNSYFYQVAGVPQIVIGGSQEIGEAPSKVSYLAWEQTIEEAQLYIEEQVGMQLGLKIELEFPASLQNELLSSVKKGESMKAATPEDTTLTEGMT